jgi:hypothetical protein
MFLVICAHRQLRDYEDIGDRGGAHPEFLRCFSDLHHGVPCADRLRAVLNRVHPERLQACFRAWVASRRQRHRQQDCAARPNRTAGQLPLQVVSGFATGTGLVPGQKVVAEKANEIVVMRKLLKKLDVAGALASIDASAAIPRSPRLASMPMPTISRREGQPADLAGRAEGLLLNPSGAEIDVNETLGKGQGRLKIRVHKVSKAVDWIGSDRTYPGAGRSRARRHRHGRGASRAQKPGLPSAPLLLLPGGALRRGRAQPLRHRELPADARRGLPEILSRRWTGHGAANMAVVRHLALALVRQAKHTHAIKRRPKTAAQIPRGDPRVMCPMSAGDGAYMLGAA